MSLRRTFCWLVLARTFDGEQICPEPSSSFKSLCMPLFYRVSSEDKLSRIVLRNVYSSKSLLCVMRENGHKYYKLILDENNTKQIQQPLNATTIRSDLPCGGDFLCSEMLLNCSTPFSSPHLLSLHWCAQNPRHRMQTQKNSLIHPFGVFALEIGKFPMNNHRRIFIAQKVMLITFFFLKKGKKSHPFAATNLHAKEGENIPLSPF